MENYIQTMTNQQLNIFESDINNTKQLLQCRQQQQIQNTNLVNYQFIYQQAKFLFQDSSIQIDINLNNNDILKYLVTDTSQIGIDTTGVNKTEDYKIISFNLQKQVFYDNTVILCNSVQNILQMLYPYDSQTGCQFIFQDINIGIFIHSQQNRYVVFDQQFFEIYNILPIKTKKQLIHSIQDQFKLFIVHDSVLKQFQTIFLSKSKNTNYLTDFENIMLYLAGQQEKYEQLSNFSKNILKKNDITLLQKLDMIKQKQKIYSGVGFNKIIIYDFEFVEFNDKLNAKIFWMLSNKYEQTNQFIQIAKILTNFDTQEIKIKKQKIKLQKIIISSFIKQLTELQNPKIQLPMLSQNITVSNTTYKSHNIRDLTSILMNLLDIKQYLEEYKTQKINQEGILKIANKFGCFVGSKTECKSYIQQYLQFHITDKKAQKFHNMGNQNTDELIQQLSNSLQQLTNRLEQDISECGICFQTSEFNVILPCCLKNICADCLVQYVNSTINIQCMYCRRGFQFSELTIIHDELKQNGSVSLLQQLFVLLQQLYMGKEQQKIIIISEQQSQYATVNILFKILYYVYCNKLNPDVNNIQEVSQIPSQILLQLSPNFCQNQTHNHKFTKNQYNKIKQLSDQCNQNTNGVFNLLLSQYTDLQLFNLSQVAQVIYISNNTISDLKKQFILQTLQQKKYKVDFQIYSVLVCNEEDENICC